MGRLERKLDLDLIARMRAGIKPKRETSGGRHNPRRLETYRGFRRNAAPLPWPGSATGREELPAPRPNISRRWLP